MAADEDDCTAMLDGINIAIETNGLYELTRSYSAIFDRLSKQEVARAKASKRGRDSKRKGKRGEDEWAEFVKAKWGVHAYRGHAKDSVVPALDDELHFEVKRVERLNLAAAYNQARVDAGSRIPIVAHRRNRGAWMVTLAAEDVLGLMRALEKGSG
jgi:hypothetical protein